MKLQYLVNSLLVCLLMASSLCAETEKPSFADLVMGGYEHEGEKNYQQAIDNYTQALELREESVTVLIRRAYSYVQIGKFTEAGEDLKAATFATPVSMSDYTSLAWLKSTCPFDIIRDGVVAVAYAKKAMKERESAETFDVLGAAYAEMKDYQRARNMVLEGLKRFPESPRAEAMKQRLELYNQKKPFREEWVEEEDSKQAKKKVDKTF
ncbi:MAG: tetratricopeptide repeat protein [Gammaproteobacteria bacterium]|nr:tetratricopeptide repeat protein [Gammaproteobacteria bacterium]